jgi:hypothetical protein
MRNLQYLDMYTGFYITRGPRFGDENGTRTRGVNRVVGSHMSEQGNNNSKLDEGSYAYSYLNIVLHLFQVVCDRDWSTY